MTGAKYSEKQIAELKKNKYVKNCINKHIVFTKVCTLQALKLLEEYLVTREIFETLGSPGYVVTSETPGRSIHRWKNSVKHRGSIEEKKG